MKSWAYKTTWTLEDVPEYWQSIWGKKAFNCHSMKRQWNLYNAEVFLRVKYCGDVAGSFSIIV